MTALVVGIFAAVYVGMALGRWPGLRVDRTGIALLGAIALHASGTVDAAAVAAAVDLPTIVVLFGLMILSAQFALAGFYDWCASRVAAWPGSPGAVLMLVVAVSGILSAVLANDIVVFAMTPLLCAGLRERGWDARPFLAALAGGANAGSAATLIGNPQNILIGQVGGLDFWAFLLACGPPSAVALVLVYASVRLAWRATIAAAAATPPPRPVPRGALDRGQLVKGGVATVVLLLLFATPLPHVSGVLAVAGFLLVSRRLATPRILALVDWPLLLLFAGLFVVTAAFGATGLAQRALAESAAAGFGLERLGPLAAVALVGSNTIGNVPAVVLVLAVAPDLGETSLYALAVLSTLAGNLLLVGSIANIIVAQRAAEAGVAFGFRDHARAGIPMTVLSMAAALAWLAAGAPVG